MGIPSYFSYIVKNHIEIIKKLVKQQMKIHNLYMDCNSIIYDAVRSIDSLECLPNQNKIIINRVVTKIEEYIALIGPKSIVYIAFDGVAPVAKLEQQRTRRYKSWFQNEMTKTLFNKTGSEHWNTSAITPGTAFMSELNDSIYNHFSDASKYGVDRLIVSTSNIVGEGEHKIFQYIRDNPDMHSAQTSVVYGLDADLIMLSINHLPISRNIYLFRETPEFIKSIDASLEPNETYLMDIPLLADIITHDMNNGMSSMVHNNNRVYDYIFLCFFLGNDFMPHFPAINIRTGGVDKMLNAYKATIGNTNECLTDGKTIYWKNVRKVIAFLVDMEDKYIQNEMKLRDKREKYKYPTDTPEKKYLKFEAIPTYERELEKYINPFKNGWQQRYYKSLFKVDRDEERCKQISINYLQGLEWTMKYYTTGCPDWRWCYQYNYPPLLQDLLKYIPYFDTSFIKPNNFNAVSPLTQLCYVLPKQSLHMLPKPIYNKLMDGHPEWYPTDCEFVWAYSKYFWESHVELPVLDIGEVEELVLDSIIQ